MYDFSARNMNMVTKIVLLCHIFLRGWNFVFSREVFETYEVFKTS